jgi:hypothetical protein
MTWVFLVVTKLRYEAVASNVQLPVATDEELLVTATLLALDDGTTTMLLWLEDDGARLALLEDGVTKMLEEALEGAELDATEVLQPIRSLLTATSSSQPSTPLVCW